MNQKEWTIMIYMAGDNNLAVDMAYAMEQIKEWPRGADSPNLSFTTTATPLRFPRCIVISPNREKHAMFVHTRYPTNSTRFPRKHNENAATRTSILNFVDWCVNKVEVENKRARSFRAAARRSTR